LIVAGCILRAASSASEAVLDKPLRIMYAFNKYMRRQHAQSGRRR
jgi:hypothetical protein